MVKYRAVAVAVAVAVSGGGAVAVAVAVAGLTKRFFNHIQKDFLINVRGYEPDQPEDRPWGSLGRSLAFTQSVCAGLADPQGACNSSYIQTLVFCRNKCHICNPKH